MSDPFRSAKSVLRRADHHIADLKSAVQVFTADKPYVYRVDKDAKTGKYVHKAVFSEDFSDDVSCIMFDAVNNLRACLDQIVNVIENRHTNRVILYSSFPFDEPAKWLTKVKGMNKIPAEIRSLFEGYKAYKGGNNALWALNYIVNIKKHGLLVPTGFGGATITLPGFIKQPQRVNQPFNAEKNEIIMCISDWDDFRPYMEFRYSIVLSHSEPIIDGQEPVSLINAMRSEVIRIMAETETECRRIGLT
jgi:hypothetical protein